MGEGRVELAARLHPRPDPRLETLNDREHLLLLVPFAGCLRMDWTHDLV